MTLERLFEILKDVEDGRIIAKQAMETIALNVKSFNGGYAVLSDGWRDAQKEFPKHRNNVLIFCNGCGADDYYSLGRFTDGRWIDKFDTCVLDAIGWMELPRPPAFA